MTAFQDLLKASQRAQYSKRYDVPLNQLTNQKMEDIDSNENTKALKRDGGVASIVGAGMLGHKVHREGMLSGQRTFYHNTEKKNIKSIQQHGLQAARAEDADNWTHQALDSLIRNGEIPEESLKGKVYLGNNPEVSFGVGLTAEGKGLPPDALPLAIPDYLKNRKNLKVQIPLKEMNQFTLTDNPEVRGAKSGKEFHEMNMEMRKGMLFSPMIENPKGFLDHFSNFVVKQQLKQQDRSAYNSLAKNTTVIEGDIPSKYIKGGEGFEALKAGDILGHAMERPGLVAKGIGLGAAGLGLAGVGGKLLYDGGKKTDYRDHHEEHEKEAEFREDHWQPKEKEKKNHKKEIAEGVMMGGLGAKAGGAVGAGIGLAKGKQTPLANPVGVNEVKTRSARKIVNHALHNHQAKWSGVKGGLAGAGIGLGLAGAGMLANHIHHKEQEKVATELPRELTLYGAMDALFHHQKTASEVEHSLHPKPIPGRFLSFIRNSCQDILFPKL